MLSILLLIINAQFRTVSKSNAIQKVFNAKKAIVCIETRSSLAPFALGRWSGTGFIVDKKRGLIITNAHVSGGNIIASIEMITSTGRRIEAKHLFSNPFIDFSILKVDPKKLDNQIEELPINTSLPQLNENVTIYSNSESNNFSIHDGRIANLYESIGYFPVQAIRISVIARGGSSGSALLNTKGEVMGLVFAGSETALWAIPMGYIKDILDQIDNNKPITIGTAGIILDYISIDEAVRHYKYPEKHADTYHKKYPNSFNRALYIQSIQADGLAEKILFPGDILFKVEGEEIGPSHYKFSQHLNKALAESKDLQVTVYRDGNELNLTIPLREAFKKTRYIKFGGATIIESDETMNRIWEIPLRSIVITHIENGTMFDDIMPSIGQSGQYAIVIKRINNIEITDFNHLKRVIEELVKNQIQYFHMTYQNYGFYKKFSATPYITRAEETQYVSAKHPNDYILEKYDLEQTPEGDNWKVDTANSSMS